MGELSHRVGICLTLLKVARTFSKGVVAFHINLQQSGKKVLVAPHTSSPALNVPGLLNFSSSRGFYFIFPWWQSWTYFYVFISRLYIFFSQVSVQIFCLFFVFEKISLTCRYPGSLFNTRCMFQEYFLSVYDLSIHVFSGVFWTTLKFWWSLICQAEK